MEHPFQVGTKVAVVSGFESQGYVEDVVAKVHKTGRFTLAGKPGAQWRTFKWTDRWRAEETGNNSRFAPTVHLINEAFLAEQAEKKARLDLRRRANAALHAVRDLRADWLTEWQVEALEYFVALQKGAE